MKTEKKPTPKTNVKSNQRRSNKSNRYASRDKNVAPSDTKRGAINDAEWYNINPQIIKDVASIPYNRATGLNWNMDKPPLGLSNQVTPGIFGCAILLDPLSNSNYDDPINVCAREIVAMIRSFNSGAANYDPNDYMIRVLGQCDILAYINFAIRAYATINMYSPYNRYMPDALLKIQGLDPDWMRRNANHYRARLNTLITKAANIIYVPEQINLFKRAMWLFTNYYSDSECAKDQLYVLFPENYHIFEIDPNTQMGMLKNYRWSTVQRSGNAFWEPTLRTGDDLLDVIESMLEPYIEDQDLCIINGDMIKAYGPSRLSFAMVPDVLIAQPVYVPEVLWQIRNSRCLPEIDGNWSFLDVVQDAGGSYLERSVLPTFADTFVLNWNDSNGVPQSFTSTGWANRQYHWYYSDLVLDTDRLDPDPLLNVENTRLALVPIQRDSNNAFTYTSGPDIVSYYVIVTRQGSMQTGYSERFLYFKSLLYDVINITANTGWGRGVIAANEFTTLGHDDCENVISGLTAFRYSPMIYLLTELIKDDGSGGYTNELLLISEPLMSQNNIAFITNNVLDKINYTCLLSLLGIKGPNVL